MSSVSNVKHIAFIPDGNRRWAKQNGISLLEAYKIGLNNIVNMSISAQSLGIKYVTFFAFSLENERRSDQEKSYISTVFDLSHHMLYDRLSKIGCRIRFIGDGPKFVITKYREIVADIEERTRNNTGLDLFLCVGYGGRQEIVKAAQKCAEKCLAGKISPVDIDAEMFSNELQFAGIPSPDILIRTSGEQRISNFMLWHTAYSELFFCEKYWPDFSEDDLKDVIKDYALRERRYGA